MHAAHSYKTPTWFKKALLILSLFYPKRCCHISHIGMPHLIADGEKDLMGSHARAHLRPDDKRAHIENDKP